MNKLAANLTYSQRDFNISIIRFPNESYISIALNLLIHYPKLVINDSWHLQLPTSLTIFFANGTKSSSN